MKKTKGTGAMLFSMIAVIVIICLFIVAGNGAKKEAASKEIRVGLLLYRGDDTFISTLRSYIEEKAKEYERKEGIKVTLDILDAKSNQNTQNNQVDRMLELGCDARQSGTYQGEEILETETKGDINGDGKVSYIMIQGDPENVDAQYRTEFSVKALTDAGVEVEELLKQRGDWDQAKAQQIAQDALNQYGDKIEVIFCNNDAMALGALQAIEAAGRKVNEDIYLVGVDALTEAVQNVIDGKQTGTVFNDHFSQAKAAADAAVKFIGGEEVDAKIPVDYIKVTNANAQEILDKLK